jgi:hypothetical protein
MKTKFKSTLGAVCYSLADQTRLTILFTILWLAMLAGPRVSAQGFNSGIIDFSYNDSGAGYPVYGPGAAAIGSAGDLWNTVGESELGQQISPVNLFRTDGASTDVQWSYLGGGGILSGLPGTYGGLVDVSTVFWQADLTGLTPNQQYSLYLYSTYSDEVISVNGTAFTTYGIQSGAVNSLTAGIEYDVQSVTADSSGTLTFLPVSSLESGVAFITSWQIEPVPEPSALGLLAVGTIILLVQRRRILGSRLIAG